MPPQLHKIEQIKFPTVYGEFQLTTYQTAYANQPEMKCAITLESPQLPETPLVRIQSACLFGETFKTTQCDCGEQLDMSLRMIGKHGGILYYLDQEGRGHGLFDKTRELKLQESGLDTVEASEQLGLQPDSRNYQVVIDLLREQSITHIKLLTNNPRKLAAFADDGITVVERIPVEVQLTAANAPYLNAKKHKLGHLLEKYVK